MAQTNFNALTTEQKTVWSRDLWSMARNASFMNNFMGRGSNSMIQRITELTKSEKGTRAVMTLVPDLVGDGVTGDNALEDNEEALSAYDRVIQIDQLRNAVRNTGRITDQKSIVDFRSIARDRLAYWMGDRMDQMAFLTLAGEAYTKTNNGGVRPVKPFGQNLGDLEFAGDVTVPSTNREFYWDPTAKVYTAGDATNVAAGQVISYNAIVKMKALAKNKYLKGVRSGRGGEMFHCFLTPDAMAQLRLDDDFVQNSRHALQRSKSNPLFAGADSILVDGVWFHEYRHVYDTVDATGGNKFGATGTVDGYRVSFCGAQSMAVADIGTPYWDEDDFDYENNFGIAVGKMFGYLKPQFFSIYDGSNEDFGVMNFNFAYA